MGCKSSKDGGNPSSKPAHGPQSPQKGQSSSRQGTPSKPARKDIKKLDEKALSGVKVADLPQFIK